MSLFQKTKQRNIISNEEYSIGGGVDAEKVMISIENLSISSEGIIGGIVAAVAWLFKKIGSIFTWIIDRFKKASEKPSDKVLRRWSTFESASREKDLKLMIIPDKIDHFNGEKETDKQVINFTNEEESGWSYTIAQRLSVMLFDPKEHYRDQEGVWLTEIRPEKMVENIKKFSSIHYDITIKLIDVLKKHHEMIINMRKALVKKWEKSEKEGDQEVIGDEMGMREIFYANSVQLLKELKKIDNIKSESVNNNGDESFIVTSPTGLCSLFCSHWSKDSKWMKEKKEKDFDQYRQGVGFNLHLTQHTDFVKLRNEDVWDDLKKAQEYANKNKSNILDIIKAITDLNEQTKKETDKYQMTVESLSKEYLGETGQREFDKLIDEDSKKKGRKWIAEMARHLLHVLKNIPAIVMFLNKHISLTDKVLNELILGLKIKEVPASTSNESYFYSSPLDGQLAKTKLGGVYLRR